MIRYARSVLFIFLFYLLTLIQMIFWTPIFFIVPREEGWKVARLWALFSLWLQHVIVGTRFDFRGLHHMSDVSGCLIAAKHQSSWETYTILLFLQDPTYILKRELMWVPLFGWYAKKMRVIPVNRGKRKVALEKMSENAVEQCKEGRQIVIYPEGTRKAAYDPPAYKYGITHMYTELGAPVIPVATNSGLFWPRNQALLHKGTTVMEFMPAIAPGLEPEVFTETLINSIETRTSELLGEAERDPEFSGGHS